MTLELKPLGNACNLACTYCYQEPMRLAGNAKTVNKYDLDKMMKIADDHNRTSSHPSEYTIFGGEALLVPKKDLEKIFKRSFEKHGRSGMQTNGSLIDDDHIEMFKKYNVNVGISIDGPNELNNARKSLSAKQDTLQTTKKIMENIQKLSQEGIKSGIILTLHRGNAGTDENLERLKNFMKWLGELGNKSGIIHMLEVDSKETEDTLAMTEERSIEVNLSLAEFFKENRHLRYEPFSIMEDLLKEENAGGCVWHSCDPMNTQSVFGIEGNGQISNCGMVNKEGVEWTKADTTNPMRDIVLGETPYEHGGCQGCRFFTLCNGYCPGSAIDGDWRNRTVHCKTIQSLFSFYEDELESRGETPFTKRDDIALINASYIKLKRTRGHADAKSAIKEAEKNGSQSESH